MKNPLYEDELDLKRIKKWQIECNEDFAQRLHLPLLQYVCLLRRYKSHFEKGLKM